MKTPVEQYIEQQAEWHETVFVPDSESDGLPYATHSGILKIFGKELKVHRLSSGQVIMEAESAHELLGSIDAK